jgi:hypothetical protein
MRDDDKLQFLFASAFERSAPGDDCPEPLVLVDAVRSRLPDDLQGAVIDHVAVCPVCAEAWRLAVRGEVGTE